MCTDSALTQAVSAIFKSGETDRKIVRLEFAHHAFVGREPFGPRMHDSRACVPGAAGKRGPWEGVVDMGGDACPNHRRPTHFALLDIFL